MTQVNWSKGCGMHFSLMRQLDREQAPAISWIHEERNIKLNNLKIKCSYQLHISVFLYVWYAFMIVITISNIK